MQRTIKPHVHWLVAALLAGCSGLPFLGAPSAPATSDAAQPATNHSWMAPSAKHLDLLYVSDYETNDVYAYSYPQGKRVGVLAGILKGFVYPTGLCADASGNVFVPDSANSTVLEYAHGSTRRVRQLGDPNQYPYSCAVDSATGDLAVVNFESLHGSGSVSIYPHARGEPANYANPYVYKYYFAAYDGDGNLFIDGTYDAPSAPFAFLELEAGKKALRSVTLLQSFRIPAGIGWDGRNLGVADSKSSTIYRFAIRGNIGSKVGSVRLSTGRYVTQFTIAGHAVAATSFHGHAVGFWPYPAGGAPAKSLPSFGEPFGITLSAAPH